MLTPHSQILLQQISKVRFDYNDNPPRDIKSRSFHDLDHMWLIKLLSSSCDELHKTDPREFKELFEDEAMSFGFMWEYIKSQEREDLVFHRRNKGMLNIFARKMFIEMIARWRRPDYPTFKEGLEESGFNAILTKMLALMEKLQPSLDERKIFAFYFVNLMKRFAIENTISIDGFIKSITDICNNLGVEDKDAIPSHATAFLLWCLSDDSYRRRANEYDSLELQQLQSDKDTKIMLMCKEYLNAMADVNKPYPDGRSIMHLLFEYRRIHPQFIQTLIKQLLDKKADFTMLDRDKVMPLTAILDGSNAYGPEVIQAVLTSCTLTEKQAEQSLVTFISARSTMRHNTLIISNLLQKIKAANPAWNNWLLTDAYGGTVLDAQKVCTDHVFSYFALLKVPFSEIFKALQGKKNNNLAEFINDALYCKEAHLPATSQFNDVWSYLALNSEVCAAITDYDFGDTLRRGFYRGNWNMMAKADVERNLLGNSQVSPLKTAAKTHNVQFFILVFKSMFEHFSEGTKGTKQQVCDAIINMDASSREIKPLMDYLESYAAEFKPRLTPTSWSWRKGLYEDLKTKYNPPKAPERPQAYLSNKMKS